MTKLKKINISDKNDVKKMVTDIEVMKYVGLRKIWNEEKINNFIKYTIHEQNSGDENRVNALFYKITDNNNVFNGLIGIHKYKNENDHNLTIMLSKNSHGKGVGTKSLKMMLEKFHQLFPYVKKIISNTLSYNISAQKMMNKVGFVYDRTVNMIGAKYKSFVYHYSLHKIINYYYPYLKHFKTIEQRDEMFKNLQNLRNDSKTIETDGKFKTYDIEINYEIDKEHNRLTDYFTETCRVLCIFKGNKLSPFDYYQKNKGYILRKSTRNGYFDYDKFEDTMYNSVRLCNNFQISIIMGIFNYFKPKRVLDSSAGWGDRLICSMAYGTSYVGVDPSPCLKPLYTKIIDTLAPISKLEKSDYVIINKPFEQITKTELGEKFDLSFTSPPFFDLEIYSDDENQSVSSFSNEQRWIKYFLNVLADINIHYLKKNAYFVIYVPEYKEFMDYMASRKDVKYCGEIYYHYSHNVNKKRKILVWKKTI